MKNLKVYLNFLSFMVLSLLILSACNQEPKDVTAQMKNNANKFMEAYNSDDANAVAMMYTTDAKLFPENSGIIDGQSSVEAFWNNAMVMGIGKLDITTEAVKAAGNLAVEEGLFKSFTKDGQMIGQGKYISVLTKENGEWKINEHIWNSSIPESPIKGAWSLVEIKNTNNGAVAYQFPGGGFEMKQIKIWTNGYFSFSGSYTMNNETMDNYGGGTYTMDGNNIYSENVEYHTSKPMVGTSVKMKIEVNGNTLTQIYPVDDDGNYDEKNYTFEKYTRLD